MRKVADFGTFKNLKKMSYNDFNRWVSSVYGSGFKDGWDKSQSEYGENPLFLDEDSLYEIFTSVPGIGDKTANKLIDRLIEEWEAQQNVQTEGK